MSKKQMNNEAGFMGLEGMGALLFYLVMIAGAALLVAQLFAGGKLSEAETILSSMRMNIQQLYTAQGNYGEVEDITETIAKSGVVPDGSVDAAGTGMLSPWNTDITVAAVGAATGTPASEFAITVVAVPQDDCVKFATYDLNGWDKIEVGGNAITSVTSAQGQCTGDLDITFTTK